MKILIRPAKKEDAPLIGKIVAMALGPEGAKDYVGKNTMENAEKVFAEIALREDSQYSFKNSLIAEVAVDGKGIDGKGIDDNVADGKVVDGKGVPAAAIVGYDGGDLNKMREATLSIIRKYNPDIKVIDDETEAGEYYIDSLGVLPEFRGHHIAGLLIDALISKASTSGHNRIGLLADYSNERAQKLYRKMHFKEVGEKTFFGHPMKHMAFHVISPSDEGICQKLE